MQACEFKKQVGKNELQASLGHIGHSAEVKMHLAIDGERIAVRQMGPDFLILDPAPGRAPIIAQLYLSVDGTEREWDVHLPEGISAGPQRVIIAKAK